MATIRSHIGVTTETAVQSAPSAQSVPSGLFQAVGITAKGPLNYGGVIRNMNEYLAVFGNRTSFDTLFDTVRSYFQEGGAEAVITRVVGPAATNGTVTVPDDATTPVDSVSAEIIDPGPQSADYRAVVSTNTDNTFNFTVMDSVSGRTIVAFQRAESPTDLASQALGNEAVIIRALGTTNPKAGVYNFTAGTDDRLAIDAESYRTALAAHKGIRPGVAVGIPGMDPRVISDILGEHCAETSKIGLLDVPANSTIDEAASIGDQLLDTAAYGSYLSMPLFPAIRVPDGTDRTRVASPIGYAAAHRSVTHRVRSFAAAVAGPAVKTLWQFQPSVKLSEEDINFLNSHGVNGIQSGSGAPFLNNWSSLSQDPGLYDLNVRDAMNNLTALFREAFQSLLWRPNDGRENLRAEAKSIVDNIMAPLVAGNYLFPTRDMDGNFVDAGYTVQVEDIRTSGQPAPYDRVQIAIGLKLSPTLRHIHVPIRNVDLRSAL